MNYVIATYAVLRDVCRLGVIQGFPAPEELQLGRSRIEGYPADVSFAMSKKFPNDIKLADSLKNLSSRLVVSERLKKFLESVPGALKKNEILPVAIVNHKGRKEKDPYFIVHQIDLPKCLDEAKSVGVKSALAPDTYGDLEKMVLDLEKIDPELMIFRVAQYQRVPIIRRDLAEKIRAENFTGIKFAEIDGFDF